MSEITYSVTLHRPTYLAELIAHQDGRDWVVRTARGETPDAALKNLHAGDMVTVVSDFDIEDDNGQLVRCINTALKHAERGRDG